MDNVLDDLDVDKCEECEKWTTTGNTANVREHNGTLRTLCLDCTFADLEHWVDENFPSE